MYPKVPYNGYTWPLTQHMGVVDDQVLFRLVEACLLFKNKNASERINGFLVRNNILTQNIRSDSGKIDAWRDYQQILSELGLIVSTQISDKIIVTPLGLSYYDGIISFEELITLQALKYQYPNGHKTTVSPSLKDALSSSDYGSLTELQTISGVLIRPAVLIFMVMSTLKSHGYEPYLTTEEMQRFVMRCSTNNDYLLCTADIEHYRKDGIVVEELERARRNAQDWMKFLNLTPLFSLEKRNKLILSRYSIANMEEILSICNQLSRPNTFWYSSGKSLTDRIEWYNYYGSLDLSISLIPRQEDVFKEENFEKSNSIGKVQLQDYKPADIVTDDDNDREITSTYSYKKAHQGRCLHDKMVDLIAGICKSNGADVYCDPSSVDLLATKDNANYLIEVKSVTPKNLIARLRYALGQILHYDYLLNKPNRRLMLGFTSDLPANSWIIPFLNRLDVDLLTPKKNFQALNIYSGHPEELSVFKNQLT